MKHLRNFNESTTVNQSDVIHPEYGEIKIGDTIEWWGDFFDGYDDKGGFKNKHQTGVNKVKEIYKDGMLIIIKLDNRKEFILKSLREPNKVYGGWKKLDY